MFSSRTAVAALFASLLVWGTRINAGEPQKLFVNPFPDVCCEDLNWNWFEPIHCDCPDGAGFNSGFFFTYERMVLRGSRPNEASDLASQPTQNAILGFPPMIGDVSAENSFDFSGDWTWGNRFEFGYVDDDAGGWSFGAIKIDSPDTLIVEDHVNRNDQVMVDLLGDPVGNSILTLNDFNFYSFELNRIFRVVPNGKSWFMMETFLGPRYIRMRDHADRRDNFGETAAFPTASTPNSSLVGFNIDDHVWNRIHTDNDLFGGQFGTRFRSQRGRWVLGTDVRGFVFNNFRSRERTIILEENSQQVVATYGADGNLGGTTAGAVGVANTTDFLYDDSNHFVWGGELHLNATYSLTKTIGLQAGFQTIIFADGIGRGMFTTDEMFALTGGSFGFTINR